MPLVDQPAQVIDPDHVMHNMETKVVWGQDTLAADACVIGLEHLSAGANALSPLDEVLNRILARGGDKHLHACSLLLTIHPRLQNSLRPSGTSGTPPSSRPRAAAGERGRSGGSSCLPASRTSGN